MVDLSGSDGPVMKKLKKTSITLYEFLLIFSTLLKLTWYFGRLAFR